MNRTIKKTAALFLAVWLCFALAACGKTAPDANAEPKAVVGCSIQHEPEFGGVYIEMTIDAFNALGYIYGDSVTVRFSNGYTLENIPYYNGYYVDAGQPLLIAYPGYDYIKAGINYGDDLWTVAGLDETCTADISLFARGGYLDIQNARDIHYTDERNDYSGDVVFANFRSVKAGTIRENTVFRAASPCDNQHGRAPFVDKLTAENGVQYILNLSDNEEKVQGYLAADDFDSPNFLTLYEGGKVKLLSLSMNYMSDEFKTKIADGFTAMAENEGPYLIHCTEGKDRTGFVCMLLEALAGASYQEIVDDYMLTYANYYDITETSDKQKYDVILDSNLVSMLKTVVGDESVDITGADLSVYAKAYLQNAGMRSQDIETLLARITQEKE